MPSQQQQNSCKVRNENIQRLIKKCKISNLNMNVEVFYAGIHEDYVTTTIFTAMFLNGLLVLVAPNF